MNWFRFVMGLLTGLLLVYVLAMLPRASVVQRATMSASEHKATPMTEAVNESVPLIWTSKGNLPIADLRYEHSWDITPTYYKFSERYYLGDEIVKEGAHVYSLMGLTGQGLLSKET